MALIDFCIFFLIAIWFLATFTVFCDFFKNNRSISQVFRQFHSLMILFLQHTSSRKIKYFKFRCLQYFLLFSFAASGIAFIASTTNTLLNLFFTLELQGLFLYSFLLIEKNSGYLVNSNESTTNSLRYFILGAFSSCIFLFGFIWTYEIVYLVKKHFLNVILIQNIMEHGTCKFEDLAFLGFFSKDYSILGEVVGNSTNCFGELEIASYNSLKIIKLATPFFVSVLLCGLLFKVAAAPFHLWVLDVYEESPTSSTVIFAAVTKISFIVILIKICYYCFYTFFVKDLSQYISFIGLFSIFIGSVVGLTERKIKSLLTFSSINNIGYLLVALASGVKSSIQTTFLYLINYTNANLSLWAILLTIQLKKTRFTKKLNKDFSDIFLIIKKNRTLLILSVITIFSLAGIPPFIGFLTKMSVLLTLIETKASLNVSVTVILSIASAFYYLRILKIMQFEESSLIVEKLNDKIETLMCSLHIIFNFFTVYQSLTPWVSFLLSQKIVIC